MKENKKANGLKPIELSYSTELCLFMKSKRGVRYNTPYEFATKFHTIIDNNKNKIVCKVLRYSEGYLYITIDNSIYKCYSYKLQNFFRDAPKPSYWFELSVEIKILDNIYRLTGNKDADQLVIDTLNLL